MASSSDIFTAPWFCASAWAGGADWFCVGTSARFPAGADCAPAEPANHAPMAKTATRTRCTRISAQLSLDVNYVDRGVVSDTREDRRLRGRGRASGNAPGHRTRRVPVVLRFFLGSEGSQCRCAIGCERPLERLVGQMTDRAVRF